LTEWNLLINNISGIKGEKEFKLTGGLNLIYGLNATGKTTIINSLKLLNNIELFYQDKRFPEDYRDFLHRGESKGKIELRNGESKYYIKLETGFSKDNPTKLYSLKVNASLISQNPDVTSFSFVDKDNQLMKSIEYNGNISILTDQIIKISKIKYYEKIRNITNNLFLEYQKKKEEHLKKYHYKRKEIELQIEKNEEEIINLEEKLEKIQLELLDVSENNNFKIKSLIKEKKRLKKLIDEVKHDKLGKIISDIQKLEIDIETIKENLEKERSRKKQIMSYENIEQTIYNLQKEIEDLDIKINNLRETIESNKEKLKGKIFQVELLNETLSLNDHTCPHCLNKIDRHIIENRVNKITNEIEKIKIALKDLTNKNFKLSKKKHEINQKIHDLKSFGIDEKKLMLKIENNTKKLERSEYKLNKLLTQRKINESNLNNLEAELNEITNELISLTSVNNKVKAEQEDLSKKIRFLKENNEKNIETRAKYIREIMYIPKKYDEILNKAKSMLKELDDFIDEYFYALIDEINDELKKLIKILGWTFKSVKINDDLEIKIYNYDNIPLDFWSLSGFERKSIAILIILIIKNKFFPEYPLFAIDEHLDSADNERFYNFIKFLQVYVLNNNIKLFLVTMNKLHPEINTKIKPVKYNDIEIYNVE